MGLNELPPAFGGLGGGPMMKTDFDRSKAQKKPRLLFFQWDHRPNHGLSGYMLLHANQHVKCLSQHFKVTVVNKDCDYGEMCDLHEPDLVLVESGYQSWASRRPIIKNLKSNTGIPKLGLHNADAWADRCSGFLSDMEAWGIETYFSICTTTTEYMPYIANNTFVWPNFIDPELFHDYRVEKTVPVMVTGKAGPMYPWRRAVFPIVTELFPCLICPQFPYESALAPRTLSGEPYARALNASRISLTCGTMAREVVRKHFEIPACGTCVITERASVLQEAGFEHMKNCVFAEPSEVVDAIDHLLRNPDELHRITRSGHDLVHARHTLWHRPQIYQWLMLRSTLGPDETIVQLGPFGDLVAQPRSAAPVQSWISHEGRDRPLVQKAYACLWSGSVAEAQDLYAQCLQYESFLPEPRFGLAICSLHVGRPEVAADILAKLIEGTTVDYGDADPDPLEWAYFILATICQGNVARARELCDWYPRLAHRELSYVRQVVALLSDRAPDDHPEIARPRGERKSVHQTPERNFEEWKAQVSGILRTCGQRDLAAQLETPGGARPVQGAQTRSMRRAAHESVYRVMDTVLRWPGLTIFRPNVPPTSEFQYLRHVGLKVKRRATRSPLGARLQQMWRAHRAALEIKSIRNRLRSEGS